MRGSTVVILALASAIAVCGSGMQRPARHFENLQVLPTDISTKDLNSIMVDDIADGLGVHCTYCHSENKSTGRPDYASDAKPEKAIARAMMRMTLGINKRYFKLKHPQLASPMLEIRCVTCHQGQPHPEEPGR